MAGNILQASNARFDTTLLCLENLYRICCDADIDREIAFIVRSSLEKYWTKAKQKVSTCTVVFNPSICTLVRHSEVSSLNSSMLHTITSYALRYLYLLLACNY